MLFSEWYEKDDKFWSFKLLFVSWCLRVCFGFLIFSFCEKFVYGFEKSSWLVCCWFDWFFGNFLEDGFGINRKYV